MIDSKNLIDQLPPYFKEFDTYKDSSGKGILERFLSIPGDYIKESILDVIKTLPNVVDIDTTDPQLLNFIWEILGAVPYSHAIILDNTIPSVYKVPNDINSWRPVDTILRPKPLSFRDIIKYAISLFKIKGTLAFYPTLLNFYGFSCIVLDPTGDFTDNQSQYHIDGDFNHYDDIVAYDQGYTYDRSRLPCGSCVEVYIHIYTSETIEDSVKSRILKLLNLYRPVYVKPFTNLNVAIHSGFPFTFPVLLF